MERYQEIERSIITTYRSKIWSKFIKAIKEYELLKLLMTNAGIVMTRDVIMERVWGVDFEGESRTLDMHIKTLRQKLKEEGSLIKTVRNVGYIMNTENS